MIELDAVRRDVLQELGNIGLGNAMTALSEMTGKTYHITVPVVKQLQIDEIPHLFGDPERIAVGAKVLVSGDWIGEAAFVFSWESAQVLWKDLLGSAPDTVDECDDIRASAISEVSNIMLGNYLKSLSEMTGFELHVQPPAFVADMAAAILSSLTVEALMWDRELLTIETLFDSADTKFEGIFLYLPEVGGMEKLFNVMGIN